MGKQESFKPHVAECRVHGEYQQNVLGPDQVVRFLPGCPLCTGARLAEQLLGRAAVPQRFRDRTFESFKASTPAQTRVLGICSGYAEGFSETFLPRGTSMLLVGNPGTGKTHLACAVIHELQRKVRPPHCLYATVPDTLRRVKDTWNSASTELQTDAIRKFVRPDLLVLDEVGVQFGSDAEKMILFEIINGRYEHERPTIVVSNLDRAGVEANLGDRCVDRLREGGGQVVVFDWTSQRGEV